MNDPDLNPLLDFFPSEELDGLVGILTGVFNEALTKTSAYKQHAPKHRRYLADIVDEIQRYGGHTFANAYRGHGVYYREIVNDVAKHLKAPSTDNLSVIEAEETILLKLLQDRIASLSPLERAEFLAGLREAGFSEVDLHSCGGALLLVGQGAIKLSGFAAYKLAVIAANWIAQAIWKRGLSFAANALLTRSISVLVGPVGWTLSALWMAYDLAGPATRVTVPVVLEVARIRLKWKGTWMSLASNPEVER